MDKSQFLSTSQVAYLAGFPPSAIESMGCAGTPLTLDELTPVYPGLMTVAQAFGLAFLSELRRRGWRCETCIAAARFLARQDATQLAERLESGQRFVVAIQAKLGAPEPYENERVRLLLDQPNAERVMGEWSDEMHEHDLRMDIVDIGAGWLAFDERINDMTTPTLPRYSPN